MRTSPGNSIAEALSSLPRQRLIVAVSGGRDSMVLLHGLIATGRTNVCVAHLDHRLRGRASTADAKFVARFAADHNLPVLIGRADTAAYAKDRGASTELAARELRLTFYASAVAHFKAPRVVLAHHGDDQIETCLFNYLRGSGPAGLAGMQAESVHQIGRRKFTLLRPLLGIRRQAIQSYADDHGVPFREDDSNRDRRHSRNRLRHDVLPAIDQAFGIAFGDAILRATAIFSAEDSLLRSLTDDFPLTDQLSASALRELPLALRRRVIHRWLILHEVSEPGFAEVERILLLIDPASNVAKVNLPADLHARRSAGKIYIERPRP